MHMQGVPQDMQDAPQYEDVVGELRSYFEERIEFCLKNNVSKEQVILDPGIGFGKTVEHNVALIKNTDVFSALGCPVLLGVSRKSFIGKLCDEPDAKNRLAGSLAAAIYGYDCGVRIFRVHDVKETRQALTVHQALIRSS